MNQTLVPDQMPAALYDDSRPDRFLRGLTKVSDGYAVLMDRLITRQQHRRRPPRTRKRQVPVPAWLTLTVADRVRECDDVVSLRLISPTAGLALPAWEPGAHVRVKLPSGLIRHYSLCGLPADRYCYTIAIRRTSSTGTNSTNGGGAPSGSTEIHDTIAEGSTLNVLRPRNGFPFGGEPVLLFVAGGIGVTPLLPMVREAARQRLDWRLVYCGRSLATMPFATEVRAIDPARVLLRPDDKHGIPDPAELTGQAPRDAAVYCCGPPPLLDGVRKAADEAKAFRFERFTAAPILDGHPFEAELSRSGKILQVPADRSLLDVLKDNDPGIPYSCRQGFCGTCRQRVLGGAADHRDRHLTDDERAAGDMLICVSRAPEGERLVLDL